MGKESSWNAWDVALIPGSGRFYLQVSMGVAHCHQKCCCPLGEKISAVLEKSCPYPLQDFPGGSVVKNPSAMQETQERWVQSLGREDPLEKEMATPSSILA